jgi:hypothetical protein
LLAPLFAGKVISSQTNFRWVDVARIALCNLTARNESTHFLRSELISYIEKHWAHLRTGKRPKYWEQDLCSTIKHKSHSHFFRLHALNGRGSTTFALTGVGIPDGSVAVPKSVFEGIKSRLSNNVRETKAILSDLVITPREDRIGEIMAERSESRMILEVAFDLVALVYRFTFLLMIILSKI